MTREYTIQASSERWGNICLYLVIYLPLITVCTSCYIIIMNLGKILQSV